MKPSAPSAAMRYDTRVRLRSQPKRLSVAPRITRISTTYASTSALLSAMARTLPPLTTLDRQALMAA